MKEQVKFILYVFSMFIIMNTLVSCSSPYIGYGVVLWSHEDSPSENGQIINIVRESSILDIYSYKTKASKTEYDIDKWRVRFFNDKAEALEFKKKYASVKNLFAVSDYHGLNTRRSPKKGADIVYKLAESETVKVLEQGSEVVEVDSQKGRWYKVLVPTGDTAWVFDYYIKTFTRGDSVPETGIGQNADDQLLDSFFKNTWHPSEYTDMILDETYDLEVFRSRFGLFADRQKKTIDIILPDVERVFTYTEVLEAGFRQYIFEGTNAILLFRTDEQIVFEYEFEGRNRAHVFVLIEENIDEIIEEETERRNELFNKIIDKGTVLKSNTYGTIILDQTKVFSWIQNRKLVPDIIPSSASNTGTLQFNYYISPILSRNYEGAITFTFTSLGNNLERVFLYRFLNGGLQLTYVPHTFIDDLMIDRVSSTPFILFFEYSPE